MIRKSKKGFSFVELIIILAIVAVIAVLLVPALLANVDRSAMQKDESMMDEVVNAVQLALAEDDIFDEAYHYSVANNFLTYTDSSGRYGVKNADSEFWAPDGSGRATTITFNPSRENGKWVYILGNGYVNDMTYGNGSTITPARNMTGCVAYPAQCYFRAMSYNDIVVSARLYNRVVQSVQSTLEIHSKTYEHSSFTVFILFKQVDGYPVAVVSGSFNGTNLDGDSLAAIGSGTTDYDDDGNPNGDNSGGTQGSNYDSSDLVGGGVVTYREYPTYEGDYLDKDKFLAFCAEHASDSIHTLQIYSSGASTGVDVSHNGSGTILAWVDGDKMNVGYVQPGFQILLPPDSSYLFAADSTGLSNLVTINMDNANTQQVEIMQGIFQNNQKAEVITIDGWSCANCRNLAYAFYNCSSIINLRVSNWNTRNVENMAYLFANCGTLSKLNTESWNTTNAQDMKYMFAGCGSLRDLDVSSFTTSLVTNMESMFEGCSSLHELDVSKWDVSYSTSFKNMFKNCAQLQELDLEDWETSSTINTAGMFYNCKELKELNLISFDTSHVEDMSYMFYKCQNVELLDISNFDNLNCSSVASMFDGMVRLAEITLSARFSFAGNGVDRCTLPEPSSLYIPGANGTWMNDMGQSFTPYTIPNKVAATYYAIDTATPAVLAPRDTWWRGTTPKSSIRTIIIMNSYSSDSYDEVFNADKDNKGEIKVYIEGNIAYLVNLKNKRASKAFLLSEDASNTFSGFTDLRSITGLKLVNTINVKNMNQFFGRVIGLDTHGCNELTYVSGLENWNVQNVQTAEEAFAGVSLKSINLSNWQTPNMKSMKNMFFGVKSTNINLSGWDIADTNNFEGLFAYSNSLNEIVLDRWSPSQTARFNNMFANCPNLTTIQTSSSFTVNSQTISMFDGDENIVGGLGTTYVDDTSKYARIDSLNNPGYFTSSEIQGSMTARLYNSGSVSGAYTELTPSGAIPMDWDFYAGARLLEVNVASMSRGVQKTVTISVPAGMYIVNNSWTKENGNVESVVFTPLDYNSAQNGLQQGTGSYSNSCTGTLTYTFPTYTTATSVKCLVMFDKAIWNKDKSADSYGTQFMLIDPAVTVNYNDQIIKKIGNITSATGIGRGATGYTFYCSASGSNCFDGVSFSPLSSLSLLSSDQSSMPYFWKTAEFKCYATSTDASGNTIYAQLNGLAANGTGNKATESTENNIYSCTWNNVYSSSGFAFPRPKFIVNLSDGFVVGKKLTIRCEYKLVSMSGQTRTSSSTVNFTIAANEKDYTAFKIGGGNGIVPVASYYEDSGLADVMGYFTAYNTGIQALDNIQFKYEYDYTTTSGAPVARVDSARVACQNGQTINMQVKLVNPDGTIFGPYAVSKKSTANINGVYVNAQKVAADNGLMGKYYIKEISYTAPSFSGGTSTTYFYSSGGAKSYSSAGSIVGTATGTSKHRLTITYPDNTQKTTTITTSVTNAPSFSGYISAYVLPFGSKVTAGESVELDINVSACSYPYTNTQAFSRPELYLILPVGVNIEGVIIGNSQTATASEATPEVTRIKSVEVDGVLSYVYRVKFTQKMWFGYVVPGLTNNTAHTYTSKWIRLLLSTDSSMSTTTINIRSCMYFKDQAGHIAVSGSYARYNCTDPYDVDNDGATTDRYGTLSSEKGNESLIIEEID